MKFPLKVMNLFGRHASAGGLLILSTGYAVFLAWQEWQFREHLPRKSVAVPATVSEPARVPLDATAVAMVLGLATDAAPLISAEPLTLQASFVISNGLSKALLADAQGPRLYQVGERLPGGSILRRVEARQVVLWNKGREELLPLQPPAARFLRRIQSSADLQAPTISARYLRPLSGPSE